MGITSKYIDRYPTASMTNNPPPRSLSSMSPRSIKLQATDHCNKHYYFSHSRRKKCSLKVTLRLIWKILVIWHCAQLKGVKEKRLLGGNPIFIFAFLSHEVVASVVTSLYIFLLVFVPRSSL